MRHMRFVLNSIPPRSHHPLIKALTLLLGLALFGGFLTFGLGILIFSLITSAIVLVISGAWIALHTWRLKRAARKWKKTAHQGKILEGEFIVVERRHHNTRPPG